MPKEFLQQLLRAYPDLSAQESAIAYLWRNGIDNPNVSLSPKEVAIAIEEAGSARPNVTRLKQSLFKDKRTVKANNETFKIKIGAREKLDEKYLEHLSSRPLKRSSAVIPLDLLKNNSRKYILNVCLQLNASYEYGLFDCCSVMCRRLLETLVIEVYEHRDCSSKIISSDGNYQMFSGLLRVIETDASIKLGRNALRGLKAVKDLGDKSAHNRRFNARKEDVDSIKADIRTAAEELLHLAGLS